MRALACTPARNASNAYLALPGLSHTFINRGARSRSTTARNSMHRRDACTVLDFSARKNAGGETTRVASVFGSPRRRSPSRSPLTPRHLRISDAPRTMEPTTSNNDLREPERAAINVLIRRPPRREVTRLADPSRMPAYRIRPAKRARLASRRQLTSECADTRAGNFLAGRHLRALVNPRVTSRR
jgi:hypothetical protein